MESLITKNRSNSTSFGNDIPHYRSENAISEMEDAYTIGAVLGQGSFGVVNEAIENTSKTKVAIKIVKKRLGVTSAYEQVEREVTIMKKIDHENILKLHAVFEVPAKIAMVMEYCDGGELVKVIRQREICADDTIRDIIGQLTSAVIYLHRNRIIHRDIKPENILLKEKPLNDKYFIKLADFGLACYVDSNNPVDSIAGTPMYMAPEIVDKKGYNQQCDVWSIGVMLYLLLCHYKKEPELRLQEMIKSRKIEFPSDIWDHIDSRAKRLCEHILRIDPAMRMSAGEIKAHPWITNSNSSHGGNVIDMMRSYNAERRLRKGMLAVWAAIKLRKPVSLPTDDLETFCELELHSEENIETSVKILSSAGSRRSSNDEKTPVFIPKKGSHQSSSIKDVTSKGATEQSNKPRANSKTGDMPKIIKTISTGETAQIKNALKSATDLKATRKSMTAVPSDKIVNKRRNVV